MPRKLPSTRRRKTWHLSELSMSARPSKWLTSHILRFDTRDPVVLTTLTKVMLQKFSANFSCVLFFIWTSYTGTTNLYHILHRFRNITFEMSTRNSSGDETANVNFRNDIVHALQNTIDSCMNSATDRRGYVLEHRHRFTKFNEITQCNSHYAVQCCHSRSPILVPIESAYTTSY